MHLVYFKLTRRGIINKANENNTNTILYQEIILINNYFKLLYFYELYSRKI